MPKHSALIRLVYGSPSSEVDRCVVIGWGSKATLPTEKLGLGLPVRFVGIPAVRTFPAAVARINKANQDTSQPRLVLKERAHLSEGPVAQPCSLPTSGKSSNASPAPSAFAEATRDLLIP